MQKYIRLGAALAVMALAACSSGEREKDHDDDRGRESSEHAKKATSNVKATGRVIVVELYTDEKGNYFKPANFEAHRGDTIRFTLMAGVHNVNFLADSNPGKTDLPPTSDFLQLPGQTYDVFVTMAPGKYFYQCDPHALLGMVGRIKVEDE
jgi:plastocyanin